MAIVRLTLIPPARNREPKAEVAELMSRSSLLDTVLGRQEERLRNKAT